MRHSLDFFSLLFYFILRLRMPLCIYGPPALETPASTSEARHFNLAGYRQLAAREKEKYLVQRPYHNQHVTGSSPGEHTPLVTENKK